MKVKNKFKLYAAVGLIAYCVGGMSFVNAEGQETLQEIVQENRIEGTGRFGSKRLILKGSVTDSHGSIAEAEDNIGYTILQYKTLGETQHAYDLLLKEGYNVFIDPVLSLKSEKYDTESPDYIDEHTDDLGLKEMQENTSYQQRDVTVSVIGTCKPEWLTSGRIKNSVNYCSGLPEDDYDATANDHEGKVASIILEDTPNNVDLIMKGVKDGNENTTATIISSALSSCSEDGTDIVNFSQGFLGVQDDVIEMWKSHIDNLYNQDILMVVSAGNDGNEVSNLSLFPANYSKCITVGSVKKDERVYKLCDFSQTGKIDYVSVGELVLLNTPEGMLETGTSFSAPIVTSFVANLLGEKEYTASELIDKLNSMCDNSLLNNSYKVEEIGKGIPIYVQDVSEESTEAETTEKSTEVATTEQGTTGAGTAEEGITEQGTTEVGITEEGTTEASLNCDDVGHDDELISDIAPTCVSVGVKNYRCKRCGNTHEEEYGELIPHDEELVSDTAPNCTHLGVKLYRCKYCKMEREEQYGTIGSHDDEIVSDTPPSCDHVGIKLCRCKICNKEHKELYGVPTPHTWVEKDEKTIKPTCLEGGTIYYVCSVCGEEKTAFGGVALGHDFEVSEEISPTCSKVGSKNTVCKRCGYKETNELPKDKSNHDIIHVEKQPTCVEYYVSRAYCTWCDKTFDIIVRPRLNHVLEGDEGNPNRVERTWDTRGHICQKCKNCEFRQEKDVCSEWESINGLKEPIGGVVVTNDPAETFEEAKIRAGMLKLGDEGVTVSLSAREKLERASSTEDSTTQEIATEEVISQEPLTESTESKTELVTTESKVLDNTTEYRGTTESMVTTESKVLDNTTEYRGTTESMVTTEKRTEGNTELSTVQDRTESRTNQEVTTEVIIITTENTQTQIEISRSTENQNVTTEQEVPILEADNVTNKSFPSSLVKSIKSASKKRLKVALKSKPIYAVEMQLATNKKFNKGKKVYHFSSRSKTIKNLKSGKKYYVRFRYYSKLNGKNVTGKWSKVKKVKIK